MEREIDLLTLGGVASALVRGSGLKTGGRRKRLARRDPFWTFS